MTEDKIATDIEGEARDDSKKLHVAIYKRTSGLSIDHDNFEVLLPTLDKIIGRPDFDPANMIAIGGGGIVENALDGTPGALLYASYPNFDNTGWIVSSKSHIKRSPHTLTAYVIGLGIDGMTRSQLFRNVRVFTEESGVPITNINFPVKAKLPPYKDSGLYIVGGGFRIEWDEGVGVPGVLATASIPHISYEDDNHILHKAEPGWEVRAKYHIFPCKANLTAYIICIHEYLYVTEAGSEPIYKGRLNRSYKHSKGKWWSRHPEETAHLEHGYVITGGGGIAHLEGIEPRQGQMLWKLVPWISSSPEGCFQGFTASSTDHIIEHQCTIDAHVLGIRMEANQPF